MAERFSVIGSNSFSGSHFVSKLLDQGHLVQGLSRSSEASPVFRPYSWHESKGHFTFVQVDMNDTDTLLEALHRFCPSIIVNFAAQSMVAQSWDRPLHWYQTNVMSLVKLSMLLQDLPDLRRFVQVTTPEVYGSTGGWIKESRDFRPSTPYAISRAAGDMHLFAMHETLGLPVCFTRAANVYGPGQQLYRIVPRSLLYARLGRLLRLDGGGRSTRSFIHVADVAEATYLIAQSGLPGEAYHISTNEIVSIRELVERACALTGVDFNELVVESPERPGKDDTYMLDSARLSQDLGWSPSITLEDGLRDTLNWVDSNLATLTEAPDTYVHKK